MGRKNKRARSRKLGGMAARQEYLNLLDAAERIVLRIEKSKEDVRKRHGRSSEDQVFALLEVGVKHALIADLRRTEPFSREDMDGIDICFTDQDGKRNLQVKSSRLAAMDFMKKKTGIPVVWTGRSSAEVIAMQLARIFPSLQSLPEHLKRRHG